MKLTNLVLIFLVALGLAACGSAKLTAPNTSDSSASDSSATYKIIVGDVRWTFTEVKDEGNTLIPAVHAGNSPNASTTGKFLRISYEVENIGTEKIEMYSFGLMDSQGKEIDSDSDFNATSSYVYVKEENYCILRSLAPNTVKKCEILFELPLATNVAELTAEVNDLTILGRKKAKINLQ